MQRYDTYKDSGVKWLGEIPSHWEMRKMKFSFEERSQKGFPNLPLLAATQNHGVIRKTDYENRTVEATKSLDTLKLVEIGDFVISLRSFQGGIELCYEKGIISPAYTILRPTHITAGYFKHLGKSPIFIQLLKSMVTGIREGQNIDYGKLRENLLPIPPIAEQTAIANYLDTATAKIDAAIAQQQKMIDLLNERKQIIINRAVTKGLNPNAKMKDNGVEWIGEVPEGWKIIPLKAIISFVNGYAFDSNDFKDEGEVKVIRISNIADGTIDYEGIAFVHQNQSLCPYLTKAGDLLIAMSGATTGKVGFDDLGGAYVNQRVGIIRSDFQKWVYYWLNTSYFKEYIYLSALGSAQPNISSKGIKNFRILFPSLEDYERIIENLELLCQKVDNAIGSCENQISLLQERKQIIINEVVTGKVKVM